MVDRGCDVAGCQRPHRCRGLCEIHYRRLMEHGDVGPVAPIYTREQVPVDGLCTVAGCERPFNAKGLCQFHYQRLRLTGTTDDPSPRPRRLCTSPGCTERNYGRGLCQSHYYEMRREGRPPAAERKPPSCSVDGCLRRHRCKGLCAVHYAEWRQSGRPGDTEPARPCAAPMCEGFAVTNGYCHTHYERVRRTGLLATARQKVCAVCAHPDALLIEEMYHSLKPTTSRGGGRAQVVSAEFGLSIHALKHHMYDHLTEERAMADASREIKRLAEARALLPVRDAGDWSDIEAWAKKTGRLK